MCARAAHVPHMHMLIATCWRVGRPIGTRLGSTRAHVKTDVLYPRTPNDVTVSKQTKRGQKDVVSVQLEKLSTIGFGFIGRGGERWNAYCVRWVCRQDIRYASWAYMTHSVLEGKRVGVAGENKSCERGDCQRVGR